MDSEIIPEAGTGMMNHIIVEGFVGSGKGAVSRIVAKKLGIRAVDLDKLVSGRMKMTSAEIYSRFGEVYYRAMETLILDELTELKERCVIVLGSGAATMPQNKAYLEKLGQVFYIKLKTQQLLANMKKSSKKHDWIEGEEWEEKVLKIFKEREPAYKKTADVIITGDGKTAEEIADEIIAAADK